MKQVDLSKITEELIDLIEANQEQNGSFKSCSSLNKNFDKYEEFKTTFYSSLFLSSLSNIHNERITNVCLKLSKFLLLEKQDNGTFNYWAKKFEKFKAESCPNDLDDTFCAWAGLMAFDKKLVKEADLAKITNLLIAQEEKESGPYQTWILPKVRETKWADIDLAVNANIGYFLKLLNINLCGIDNLIETAIENLSFVSSYYPEETVLFFISRFYDGKKKEKLIHYLTKKNKEAVDPTKGVLLGLSILHLTDNPRLVEQNIARLLDSKTEHALKLSPFINERSFSTKKKRYSTSKILLPVLEMELISRYQNLTKRAKNKDERLEENLKIEVKKYVLELLQSRFKPDLFAQYSAYLEKIFAFDKNGEILLLPFLFLKSYKGIFPTDQNKEFLFDLCAGNTLGWLAYTIIDNVMDEKKELEYLPIALVAEREIERLFCKDSGFEQIFQKIMDTVDYQNFYEYHYGRIDPKRLHIHNQIFSCPEMVSKKSLAHSLGPLAILFRAGFNADSKEVKALITFFDKYLTARQLNDDAHDWYEDLERGQVNYVAEMVLNSYLAKNPGPIKLPHDKTKLQSEFWQGLIDEICQIIKAKVEEARAELKKLNNILKNDFLANKLYELEAGADQALEEKGRTLSYLDSLFY